MRALIIVIDLAAPIPACDGAVKSGVTELNVRITGVAQFVCPTSTPRPTHIPQPISTHVTTSAPPLIPTPMIYIAIRPTATRQG
ncbi:MAG: hypothetical protein NZ750_11415 [Anaerolineae bacterium]|nr:hypothetical protein [Anaerolineae bacterium]MDW8174026.1 hypothetical protein [Anaerolineae bacterium]